MSENVNQYNKLTKILVLATCLTVISGIIYFISRSNREIRTSDQDLQNISDVVTRIKKVARTGRYNRPYIHIQVLNSPCSFRVSGNSYKAINPMKVLSEIHPDDNIRITVKTSEMNRCRSKSILNNILDWRNEPQIFSLQKDSTDYLTLNKFNLSIERQKSKDILWGVVLIVFLIGQFIWVITKEQNKNKT
ncbi:hypothetical protein [Portibacter marinus]|uniref:hypothetical protein n=1 Tax=Portibacter marinus TaxID=2898660 RepID=UPI001F29CF30|nr:hypothetical protein [Portibacter marinus]